LMKQIAKPATAAEIIEIIGPLDDGVLMRIVETQATPAEVLEAFSWTTADDQIGTELEHRPRGAVARVYESSSARNPNLTTAASAPARTLGSVSVMAAPGLRGRWSVGRQLGGVPWAFSPQTLINGHPRRIGEGLAKSRGYPAQEPVLGPRKARTHRPGMDD
jgi:hypothetical protein